MVRPTGRRRDSSDDITAPGYCGRMCRAIRGYPIDNHSSRLIKAVESFGAKGLFQLRILRPKTPVQMQRERNIRSVLFVHVFAQPVRFHPHAQRNVGFVDKFQPAHQRLEGLQKFAFCQPGCARQPRLMFEQFDKQITRRIEFGTGGWILTVSQIAAL